MAIINGYLKAALISIGCRFLTAQKPKYIFLYSSKRDPTEVNHGLTLLGSLLRTSNSNFRYVYHYTCLHGETFHRLVINCFPAFNAFLLASSVPLGTRLRTAFSNASSETQWVRATIAPKATILANLCRKQKWPYA